MVVKLLSRVQLLQPYMTTGKTIAMTKQTFVSKVVSLLFNMVFRLVTPGDLPDPGIEPRSPALQADALTSEPPGKQEYWSGLPFPSPEDLPNPGIEPGSPAF